MLVQPPGTHRTRSLPTPCPVPPVRSPTRRRQALHPAPTQGRLADRPIPGTVSCHATESTSNANLATLAPTYDSCTRRTARNTPPVAHSRPVAIHRSPHPPPAVRSTLPLSTEARANRERGGDRRAPTARARTAARPTAPAQAPTSWVAAARSGHRASSQRRTLHPGCVGVGAGVPLPKARTLLHPEVDPPPAGVHEAQPLRGLLTPHTAVGGSVRPHERSADCLLHATMLEDHPQPRRAAQPATLPLSVTDRRVLTPVTARVSPPWPSNRRSSAPRRPAHDISFNDVPLSRTTTDRLKRRQTRDPGSQPTRN